MGIFKNHKVVSFIAILFVLIFALVIRLIFLEADPPTSLTPSGSLRTDEGWKVHNALNKSLFGQWKIGPYNLWFLMAPVFTLIEFIFFSIFGVSLAAARLVSVFSGIGTIVLVYLIIKQERESSVALLAALFLSSNFVFTMFNRLAFLESLMLFFITAAWFFWQKAIISSRYYLSSATALAVFLAFLVKPYSLIVVPILVFAFLVSNKRTTGLLDVNNVKHYFYFFSTIVTLGLVWLFFWFLPKYDSFVSPNYGSLGESYFKLLESRLGLMNWVSTVTSFLGKVPYFFSNMPIITLLSFVFVAFSIFRISFLSKQKIDLTQSFALSWIVVCTVFLASISYRPPRYLTLLIPPMAVASAIMLEIVLSVKELCLSSFRLDRLLYVLFCLAFLDFVCATLLLDQLDNFSLPAIFMLFFCGSLLLLIMLWFLLNHFFSENKVKLNKMVIYLCIAVLVGGSIFFNCSKYTFWLSNKKYSMVKVSKKVREIVGNKAVMAGAVANTLSIENHLRSITLKENLSKKNIIEYDITHLLIPGFKRKNYIDKYPLVFKKENLLGSFSLLHNYYGGEKVDDRQYLYEVST